MVGRNPVEVPDISPEFEIREIVIAQGIQFRDRDLLARRPTYKEETVFEYLGRKLKNFSETAPSEKIKKEYISVQKTGEYESDSQKVRYIVIIIENKNDFKYALQKKGIHVIYGGHSRYGRGACFDPTPGVYSGHGNQWELGTSDLIAGTSNENGLYRLAYSYVPVPLEDIKHHKYVFAPIPVEEGLPSNESSHPFSRHPHARRSLSKVSLEADLLSYVHPMYTSASNKYYGLKIGGKTHLLLNAGWKESLNDPFDLGATELKCKTFCHFGCSSRLHFWDIVRRLEYKGWQRLKPPTDKFAYFTTAPADYRTPCYWLYHLFAYNKENKFQSWFESLEYAKKKANKQLNAEKSGYQIY